MKSEIEQKVWDDVWAKTWRSIHTDISDLAGFSLHSSIETLIRVNTSYNLIFFLRIAGIIDNHDEERRL